MLQYQNTSAKIVITTIAVMDVLAAMLRKTENEHF
jgi:hypothetical protein